jgi:glutamyl-tRNA reductase
VTADVLLVGLSHHTAPVALREQLAVDAERLGEELGTVRAEAGLSEGVIISTCNRVEVYATATDAQAAAAAIRRRLSHRAAPQDASPHLYERWGEDAVRHVFRVASSLDSMVVGEPQILGQLKGAYEAARTAGAVGPLLGRCFVHAFQVAKRVRTETSIAAGSVSVSSIACELARKIFGDLSGRRVLLIGAGKMGEAASKHLRKLGARLFVVNRSAERARELAEACGGQPRDYADLATELVSADVVITSTGSPRFILAEELLSGVMRARKRRPLFLIDIAVPRDVDPRVGELGNVFLYDLDDLQQVADENLAARRKEAVRAEAIVAAEVELFGQWLRSLEVKPTIVALRERFHAVVRAEIDRTLPRLSSLSPDERHALERMTDAMVNKLLHAPTTRLRDLANGADGPLLVDAARRLFELGDGDAPGDGVHAREEKGAPEAIASGPNRDLATASGRSGKGA